ncbi:MAG: ribosome silencing factor [Eubacteriales bacterium]
MEDIQKLPDLRDADSRTVADTVIKILNEKKSHNIKLLHVEEKTVLTDYLVLCTGNSSTQVRSLAGEIEYKMGLCGLKCWNIDGYSEADWIVLDFGCVMVHVFFKETRDFYKLEKLWGDTTEVDITALLKDPE